MQTRLSFIVPAYNESRYIEACLQSISGACQKLEIEYELIVVDNGSTDNTAELARQYTDQVFIINRESVSYARNYGVRQSSHALIAFIDADIVITERWAQCFVDNYQSLIEQPEFITGYQYLIPEQGSWIEQHWFKYIKDQLLAGGNIITSRQAFEKIDGFNPRLKTGEDYDYCIRSIEAGINYSTNADFAAIHLGYPHTLKDFVRREYWHGEGDFKTFKRFIGSQVAIIVIVYLLLHIFIIASLIYGAGKLAAGSLATLIVLNFLITYKRFSQCSLKTICINSIINYIYFLSRIGSMYKALKNRNKPY